MKYLPATHMDRFNGWWIRRRLISSPIKNIEWKWKRLKRERERESVISYKQNYRHDKFLWYIPILAVSSSPLRMRMPSSRMVVFSTNGYESCVLIP